MCVGVAEFQYCKCTNRRCAKRPPGHHHKFHASRMTDRGAYEYCAAYQATEAFQYSQLHQHYPDNCPVVMANDNTLPYHPCEESYWDPADFCDYCRAIGCYAAGIVDLSDARFESPPGDITITEAPLKGKGKKVIKRTSSTDTIKVSIDYGSSSSKK